MLGVVMIVMIMMVVMLAGVMTKLRLRSRLFICPCGFWVLVRMESPASGWFWWLCEPVGSRRFRRRWRRRVVVLELDLWIRNNSKWAITKSDRWKNQTYLVSKLTTYRPSIAVPKPQECRFLRKRHESMFLLRESWGQSLSLIRIPWNRRE